MFGVFILKIFKKNIEFYLLFFLYGYNSKCNRLRDRLHINQLIIFPLIIQRRRKLRVCAAFVFIHDYLRGHYVNYTIWQRAQASTVATSAENSEMIIGFISPLVFIPAKYTADM